MAWEAIQLRTESGLLVCDEDREVILKSVDNAFLHSDHDADIILRAAKTVGHRIEQVRNNLQAYAGRTIFRSVKRAELTDRKRGDQLSLKELGKIPDQGTGLDQIETRILVRELLETLRPQDREIVLRHMSGHTFARIDREMSLKPRSAESRFRFCKDALRAQLKQKSRQ